MKRNYFTPRDRGHVEEINKALSQLEKDYMLDFSSEKEWLDELNERFGKLLTKQQPANVTIGNGIDSLKKEVSTIELIKAEVSRLGIDAYDKYTRDNSDKEYWTYMTCKKISNFINSLFDEYDNPRENIEKCFQQMLERLDFQKYDKKK